MNRTYLDWNATAPLRPEAREAMLAATEIVGNPSSVHAEGRAAKSALERAREQVAAALGAEGADVIFTSGATESAALILAGRDLACAGVEHAAVLGWCRASLQTGPSGRVAAMRWAVSSSGSVVTTHTWWCSPPLGAISTASQRPSVECTTFRTGPVDRSCTQRNSPTPSRESDRCAARG